MERGAQFNAGSALSFHSGQLQVTGVAGVAAIIIYIRSAGMYLRRKRTRPCNPRHASDSRAQMTLDVAQCACNNLTSLLLPPCLPSPLLLWPEPWSLQTRHLENDRGRTNQKSGVGGTSPHMRECYEGVGGTSLPSVCVASLYAPNLPACLLCPLIHLIPALAIIPPSAQPDAGPPLN